MIQATQEPASDMGSDKKPARRSAKPRQSVLEKITPEELHTLRLDERSRAEFDGFVQRFLHSRAGLAAFENEDVTTMEDDRYDQLSAAEAERRSRGTAVVHFMAPRILKLRDGPAKRKWRSFLTKFRKDENLI